MKRAFFTASQNVVRVLASRWFFIAVLAFFVFEALWMVASAAYPMAFDEEVHFGVVKLFSEHWLPFMSTQPETADSFGAIIRDPSYLYHYLLSFPYRFLSIFTDNQTAIIIVLRLINVALFAWALVLFRKVLLRAKASPALAHTALAIFVLIPIVPQLAAHINYDNLLMVMLAWMCLLVAKILEGLQERRLLFVPVATLLLVAMATSVVKYESLPFVAAAVLFAGFMVWRTFNKKSWRLLVSGAKRISRRMAIVFIGAAIVLLGLLVQRYGVNIAQYHALKPKCDAVLGEVRCEAYGPWARNHHLAQEKGDVNTNPLAYTWTWVQSLHYRLFFAVSGPGNNHRNHPPLPLPAAAAVVIAISGIIALALFWRKVFAGHRLLVFFCFMSALYLAALWFEDYSQFVETGHPVAINGRYLIPILLPLAAVFGRAFSFAFMNKLALKASMAVLALALFLNGGGVLTFISRSDAAWYWPNETIINMNETAQDIVAPVLIETGKHY